LEKRLVTSSHTSEQVAVARPQRWNEQANGFVGAKLVKKPLGQRHRNVYTSGPDGQQVEFLLRCADVKRPDQFQHWSALGAWVQTWNEEPELCEKVALAALTGRLFQRVVNTSSRFGDLRE
jgi:hypothetical protein